MFFPEIEKKENHSEILIFTHFDGGDCKRTNGRLIEHKLHIV